MINKQKRSNDDSFLYQLKCLSERKVFLTFDMCLMELLGFSSTTRSQLEENRKSAYQTFFESVHNYTLASVPTMKKWFGIGGTQNPKREQVLKMGILLSFSVDEMNQLLSSGLGQMGLNEFDCEEAIYKYGLEHQLTLSKCEQMKTELRKRTEKFPEFIQEDNVLTLDDLSPEECLEEMLGHLEYFKGYSVVRQQCFHFYKNQIIDIMRQEALEHLENQMAETDYLAWAKRRKITGPITWEKIKCYINSKSRGKQKFKLSYTLRDNIMELSRMVFSSTGASSRLLAEAFPVSTEYKEKTNNPILSQINCMTMKRLSDLINIPEQRNRQMLARWALTQVEKQKESMLQHFIDYIFKCLKIENEKLQEDIELHKMLEEYIIDHRRRCINIMRSDILPMVHYVSWHLYLEDIAKKKLQYSAGKARSAFVTEANKVLEVMNMPPINNNFEIDFVLLTCFQPTEVYSFSEAMDIMRRNTK